jgi:hypothetical protein
MAEYEVEETTQKTKKLRRVSFSAKIDVKWGFIFDS